MAYWGATSIVLACMIVYASLSPSRRRYWLSVFCFTGLAVGSCFFAVFSTLFGINMANAFGPRSVSLLAYIGPLLTVGWFAYSALSLYPILSRQIGFRVVTLITALMVLYSLGLFFMSQIRFPMNAAPPPYFGIQAIYHWLLWMRVYELRKVTYPLDASSDTCGAPLAEEQNCTPQTEGR